MGFTCFVFTCKLSAQPAYAYSVQSYISYKQDTIAFTHCYLADVIHESVLNDETIIIEHGTITATGKSKEVSIPANATVIDCTGKTVLPGFVLLHEHMFYPAASISPYYVHFKQLPVTFPRLYLACGVTT
ncbi:MAG: amidohydrolase, partial [Bacteroidota bacterium]|nr:amidohydrolase [Bacteroidota bacterium]